jgi:hypothetical protein
VRPFVGNVLHHRSPLFPMRAKLATGSSRLHLSEVK